MFRSFITIAAVAGLAAGASAQQQMPAVSLQPVSNLQYGSYDFDNGFTVTNGNNRAIGPDTIFDTTGNFAYYYGVVGTDTTKQEWMDETWLPNRGLSDAEQITGMAWNYCEGGYTTYFDAYVSLYNDTVACAGSSSWVAGSPSFADCVYQVLGLPGGFGTGCWNVTINLSGGAECVLPDNTNALSGAQGTIGWSVTPFNCNGSPLLGPFLGKQADATPGSQDLFEWRDWSGMYFGSYIHAGCYWFGGVGPARADFHVAFYAAAIDVVNCYSDPTPAKDVLLLEATVAVENSSVASFNVTAVPPSGVARRGILFANKDPGGGIPGCDQINMGGAGGFTRQISTTPTVLTTTTIAPAAISWSTSKMMPPAPVNGSVVFQAMVFPATGPLNPGSVIAASNGVGTTL